MHQNVPHHIRDDFDKNILRQLLFEPLSSMTYTGWAGCAHEWAEDEGDEGRDVSEGYHSGRHREESDGKKMRRELMPIVLSNC